MQLHKEKLLARREAIRKGREKLVADLNATDGALQEVEYWLDVLDKEAAEELEKAKEETNGSKQYNHNEFGLKPIPGHR